jgi:large subunit ribosomal protein L9
MEVILKQDVEHLGYANDLVKVKKGYAMNFLIPQGMAIMATESNKKVLQENLRQKAHKEQKIRNDAEEMAKAMENMVVRIGAKAGTSGKIFGSVNAMQVADALREQFKYDIDKKNIHVDGDSIKELGNYKASVKLHKEVSVELSLEVFAE